MKQKKKMATARRKGKKDKKWFPGSKREKKEKKRKKRKRKGREEK